MQVRNVYVVVCPRSEVKYDEEAFAKRDVELKRQRLKVGVSSEVVITRRSTRRRQSE